MSKNKDLIEKIIALRKEMKIDPLNFSMHKYFTWESSLQAQIKEHAEYLYPKIVEIITEVLEENMDNEDIQKLAELQVELTNKYGDRLELMDKVIHKRVEEYIELYNEALNRILQDEEGEVEQPDWNKNN